MKPLSKIYKDLGIAFEFPIKINDENGKQTYYENSHGYWYRREYDENGNVTYFVNNYGYWSRSEYDENGDETYFETSNGYWWRHAYDENGNVTYYEDSDGTKRGTKKGSCDGKIVEVDGKKYKLQEL